MDTPARMNPWKLGLLIVFLAGCAPATTPANTSLAPNREVITINRFFDDLVSAERDDVMVTQIEKIRTFALKKLAEATNDNVRHRVALHIMQTTPDSLARMKTTISERRRCSQLQTRLQQDTENIHEIVRTLSIAGCSQHIKLGDE